MSTQFSQIVILMQFETDYENSQSKISETI